MDQFIDGRTVEWALDRATDAVGVVTLAIGAALTVSPRKAAGALGLGDEPALALGIGLTDLAIGGGLLRHRPRWPWMAARAVLNAALVSAYRAEDRRPGGNRAARAGAHRMAALALFDGGLAIALAARNR